MSTVFALSSGAPPAAIAVVRITGPQAGPALDALAGTRPEPRRAALRPLRHPLTGDLLDRALALVRDSGAIQATVERAARFAQAARAALAAFPDGPARRVLADVADYAVSRVS